LNYLTNQLKIQRAFYCHSTFLHDVCVNHCSADIFVSEQFLNGADIVAVFQQVGGKTVAEGMAGDRFGDARQATALLSAL
jgi:hypothetical protein